MAPALRAAGLLVLVVAATAQVKGTRRISSVPWLAPRAMQRREFVSMYACRTPSLVPVGVRACFSHLSLLCGPVWASSRALLHSRLLSLHICVYRLCACVRACVRVRV